MNSEPAHHKDAAARRRSRSVPIVLGLALLAVVAAVIVFGVLPALSRTRALAESAAARNDELPRVVFVEAAALPASARVVVPARLDALQATSLYAQVGGYLGPMLVDMGDVVKKDQLLVEIQTPLLDRQIEQNISARDVAQAKIDLAQARVDLSHASLERLRSVGDERAVSKQSLDEASANSRTDKANLAAARADLAAVEADGHRLAALKSLARIVAPFDGEVTARGFDAGALIVADKTDNAVPIFRVTNREEIRAMINVPQSVSVNMHVGQPVEVTVKEIPDRRFTTKITRMAPELDRTTRTLQVEARIPNADHALMPGMFAEAAVVVPSTVDASLVPGEVIVIREGKQTLPVIDAQDTLHYLPVTLGRDNGTMVEVRSGAPVGTRVATNMSRQLPEGTKVAPVARAAAKP
ncbi:MAG: efflux RND transporter periplasmic adaptor subunit [Planctomycetes bacterium]|nr:efflux RND transporter periplasmic adaptor subunit [Planctomycetota bacterium]